MKKTVQKLFDDSLGLYNQGKLNQAIEKWEKIALKDSTGLYAKAQFNLGVAYEKKGKLDKAIEAYQRVSEEHKELYAKAQVNLGVAYRKKGELDKAIEAYQRVPPEIKKQYAKAQVNLGVAYRKKGELDKAIEAYQRVLPEIKEPYAKAQFNLGIAYKNKRELDKAIEAYQRVLPEIKEQYAKAQVNLGVAYRKKGELDKAIESYQRVLPEIKEQYAKAQFNLGIVYEKERELDKAIETFNRVPREIMEQYVKAQIYLNTMDSSIINYRESLFDILKNVKGILNFLQVNKQEQESYVAHYTRPSTAFYMIDKDYSNERELSSFRLSSISGVNDPTEGNILYKWLNLGEPRNKEYAVFISCFTFNHDSLNQFRLYGKENNEEASGVSLVFENGSFFEQDKSNFLGIDIGKNNIVESKNTINDKDDLNKINKLPLYRCIYLDLGNNYISLAYREKLTFYRESSSESESVSDKIDNYNSSILELEKNVYEKLDAIRKCIKGMSDELDKFINVLELILLPLRYLVKHAAFKEEQEARIFYISSLLSPKIKTANYNTQMYVEYNVDVLSAIYKIYLSPGAEKYKDYFKRCLKDENGDKVKISSNPFRNKKY